MSLITRCPACATLFKVVPDQLRISEGWVRCGQCDEIFDASIHLLPALPFEENPAAPHESSAVDFEAIDATDESSQPVDVELNSSHLAIPHEIPLAQQALVPAPADDEIERQLPDLIPDNFSQVDDAVSLPPGLLETTTDVSQSDSSAAELPIPVAHATPDDSESAPLAELSEASFLRAHKNAFSERRPYLRATLILLSLALLLGLSGQVLLYERDRILAWEPHLKPWLQVLCGTLSCTLSPLLRIESIVIDSSSFTKIRGDLYRLNFTVKNTAIMALATPAVELTLTDSLDQPVIRRVFFPSELGGKSDTLVAGSEWATSLAVSVKAVGPVDRVAGYRLLAFYP